MGTPGEAAAGAAGVLRRHFELNPTPGSDVLIAEDRGSGQLFIVAPKVPKSELDAWWARRLLRRSRDELA